MNPDALIAQFSIIRYNLVNAFCCPVQLKGLHENQVLGEHWIDDELGTRDFGSRERCN